MTDNQILDLFRKHDYMTLEEEGFLTVGMIVWAFRYGAISRTECENLISEFY